MMNYKREEAFRYEFTPPLPCSFSIVAIGNKKMETKKAKGEIIDLSPQGAKLAAKLNIPLGKEEIKIKINFTINTGNIMAVGVLVWAKNANPFGFQYGVKFINTSVQEVITEELKEFAKHKNND